VTGTLSRVNSTVSSTVTGTASGAAGGTDAATVRALQSALAAEQAAVYAFGVVGAYLGGSDRATAAADWLAHQAARDAIEAMLRSRGAEPGAAAVAYQLPVAVHDQGDAVTLAAIIEERIAAAYLGLVAVSVTSVREFAAGQLQASALRAAVWRGSTVAFPGLTTAELSPPPRRVAPAPSR
jgi:hypothetical protein